MYSWIHAPLVPDTIWKCYVVAVSDGKGVVRSSNLYLLEDEFCGFLSMSEGYPPSSGFVAYRSVLSEEWLVSHLFIFHLVLP